MVARSEVRREKPHAREVDRPFGEQVEDHREAPRRPGHFDPVVRLPLRQAQGVSTIDEQGAVSLPQVHVTCVQLREVCDELGLHIAVALDKALQPRDQIGIREASQASEHLVLHACL